MTGGTDLTILLALAAGVISFLSPCVLPLVPAYLGQLTAIAVAGGGEAPTPGRWLAVRHALAFVAGFGAVFTFLGVTATYMAAGLADYIPTLRVIGGLILIVLGLNLAGILRIGALERTWRPLDAGAAGSLATTTGSIALGTPGRGMSGRGGTGGAGPGSGAGTDTGPSLGDRLGGRLVGTNGGLLASFGLGAIFAIGWTPCIGIILGGILTMAATTGTVAQGAILLIAYTLGLGLPFIAIALAYDRAPGLLRPLVRHGRAVSLIGGLLVVLIGVAMVFDWLSLAPRMFPFLTNI
jgi:cytochrome c-type biogenesis protein